MAKHQLDIDMDPPEGYRFEGELAFADSGETVLGFRYEDVAGGGLPSVHVFAEILTEDSDDLRIPLVRDRWRAGQGVEYFTETGEQTVGVAVELDTATDAMNHLYGIYERTQKAAQEVLDAKLAAMMKTSAAIAARNGPEEY